MIQITTDGSYNSKRNIGGWAFVYRTQEKFLICWGGSTDIRSSTQAELLAAIKALELVGRTDQEIELTSDADEVVDVSWGNAKKLSNMSEQVQDIVKEYRDLCKPLKIIRIKGKQSYCPNILICHRHCRIGMKFCSNGSFHVRPVGEVVAHPIPDISQEKGSGRLRKKELRRLKSIIGGQCQTSFFPAIVEDNRLNKCQACKGIDVPVTLEDVKATCKKCNASWLLFNNDYYRIVGNACHSEAWNFSYQERAS